jgi:hypothetical protein
MRNTGILSFAQNDDFLAMGKAYAPRMAVTTANAVSSLRSKRRVERE